MSMVEDKLITEFEQAMFDIYHRALKEAKYKASRFLDMLHENGGLLTAKMLINSPKVSDGYTALWERQRLDLTVEAVIVENQKWHTLFTEEELNNCKKRLHSYGYIKSL